MQIGDLVEIEAKDDSSWEAFGDDFGKTIVIVVDTQILGGERGIVKVEWFGTYGAFWTHTNDVVILSKSIDR